MHLIEMELYGFKSFAKRTRIRFSEDITAIVGPNGSGKSNIVDGIMWALGESSVKQLRGNKMEDVIFSGTDRQQGVNFAEVVLTFDNKDGFFDLPYEELSVSRKYFRSGESQYTINKKRVRQKDVREIFLDTGIGKNGYSFIGQGQIEEILSTRPQDRRNAFEEAAGISKFKLRKEETLRNLNKTTEHIERIDDIFSELKSRSGEMEEKREKALRLNELESEKEKYSYALLIREVASAKEKQEKIRARYSESEAAWQKEKEANRLLETAIEEKELKIESDGDSEGALNDEILTLIREKERASGDLRSKIERSEYLKEERAEREGVAETLRAELEGLASASEKQEEEVKGLKVRMDEKAAALEGMIAEYEDIVAKVAAVDSGEKSRREALDQLADRRHSLESRLQALDYLLKERGERLDQLKEKRRDWQRDTEDLTKNVCDFEEKEAQIKHASADLEADLKGIRVRLEEMKGQIDAWDNKIKNLAMGAEGIEREKRYLERLRDNHEGFQHGVKQFLKSARSESFYSGVIGPVAEHLHVEEDDALAISTALGYGGQNIILKDDRKIGPILSYLKSREMGRLTFLPLNNLTARSLPGDLLRQTAIPFRVASDCVSCEDSLRPVANFLLGRILLVDTVDEAKQLAKDLKHRYRIVTKGGDVFQVGGAVTGGQAKSGSTELYTRDSEIAKKASELEVVLKQLDGAKKQYEDLLQASEDLKNKENELAEADEKKKDACRKAEEGLFRLRSALEHSEAQLTSLDGEIEKETAAMGRDEAERIEQAKALGEISNSEKAWASKDDDDSAHWHRSLDEKREELNGAKIENQKIIAAYREASLRLEQIQREAEGINTRLQGAENEAKAMSDETEKLEASIAMAKPKQSDMEAQVVVLREALAALKESVSKERQALREEKSALEAKKEQTFNLEKDLVRLQNQLEEADRAAIIFSDALEQSKDPGNIEELLNLSVTTLRNKESAIEKEMLQIGPVDGDALEQYSLWKERVDFLSEQREDLVLSKEKLEKMIRRLDKDMRKQLEEALILINGYFNDIFRELFQGGKASLAWDEGDILEAGILISAQPPGKKLQSLSLLSGGERSMTAVALLFALLRMRQSPFCIVDEIDAALDDANIRRYSNYVKQIEDMQFIMITHRKQTMEMAHEIYGVTMEEKGISRLLFLELEEVESHVGLDQTKNR